MADVFACPQCGGTHYVFPMFTRDVACTVKTESDGPLLAALAHVSEEQTTEEGYLGEKRKRASSDWDNSE